MIELTATLADRYRIERELGHGGMATVYLADDLKHDRKVAVKIPDSAGARAAAMRAISLDSTFYEPYHLLTQRGWLMRVVGDVDGSSAIWNRAIDARDPDALYTLWSNPALYAIHGEARYQQLLARTGIGKARTQ